MRGWRWAPALFALAARELPSGDACDEWLPDTAFFGPNLEVFEADNAEACLAVAEGSDANFWPGERKCVVLVL